ncbi:hypothetical protein L218DRAFT_998141 [Marasmius fiardii PR-910]|nr:hypothetical protein L218DRAFT_998141 [Marasmius fiardii PR-910]
MSDYIANGKLDLDSLFPGGGSTPTLRTSSVEQNFTWWYHTQYGQLVHVKDCDVCKNFLLHIGQGVVEEVALWLHACSQRDKTILLLSGYAGKIDTLEAVVEKHKAEYSYMYNQYKNATKEFGELEGHFRDLTNRFKAKQVEMEGLLSELITLQEAQSELKRKRPRIEADSHATAMLVNDKGGPGQAFNTSGVTYSRNSPPWDDGRYRSGDDWEAA